MKHEAIKKHRRGRAMNERNAPIGCPKGYRVTVFRAEQGMYDCRVWKDGSIVLGTSGTMFEFRDRARACGVRRAWDMYHGRPVWT